MRRVFPGILLGVSALLVACAVTAGDEKKVLEVVGIRAEALNRRDLPAYLSVISLSYRDRNKDYQGLRRDIEAGFRSYERVSLREERLTAVVKNGRAEVNGRYALKVVVRGQELVFEGVEHIRLVHENDGWKIVAGL